MIILVLTILLMLLFAVLIFVCWLDDDGMPVSAVLFALAGAAVVGVFGVVASLIVTEHSTNVERVNETTTPLRALDTGSSLEGTFFLGSGHLGEDPGYTYLYERQDGGVILDQISAKDAVVFEFTDPDGVPRMVTGYIRPVSTLWSLVAAEAETYFYVPEGSVQAPEYRVDVDN